MLKIRFILYLWKVRIANFTEFIIRLNLFIAWNNFIESSENAFVTTFHAIENIIADFRPVLRVKTFWWTQYFHLFRRKVGWKSAINHVRMKNENFSDWKIVFVTLDDWKYLSIRIETRVKIRHAFLVSKWRTISDDSRWTQSDERSSVTRNLKVRVERNAYKNWKYANVIISWKSDEWKLWHK